ncbi:MAG: HisA/HisF-related TIM barrel protein [Thermoproteota archaeon]
MMMVIPSIDIMGSRRVEVVGHAVKKAFEGQNPIDIAISWEKAGARMLHLVDIDAALNTGRYNADMIKGIISSVRIPVQVAGGIRHRDRAKEFLSTGASRVVIRLRPCSMEMADEFAGLEDIVLGLDYLGGNIWRDTGRSGIRAEEGEIVSWTCRLKDSIGLRGILFTDVGREGLLSGICKDVLEILSLLGENGLELMYAGGVSSLEDVLVLKELDIDGIVIGKALYDGVLSFEALRRVAEDG